MEYFEKHIPKLNIIALYINIKNKGLVIITECSHTGLIKIIKHGQKINWN